MTPLLQVEALTRHYGGVRAVDGVSFTLAEGEVRALIGPNGAGKSTCFALLSGLERPDRGRIRFAGRDITGLSPQRILRLGLARTFQIPAIFPSLDLADNLRVALLGRTRRTLAPWPPARRLAAAEIDELLSLVGLAERRHQPAGTLAYGDRKRLELAMALAHRPRLLLLDEPTAGMALSERFALIDQLLAIVRARGLTVLFTEHDMDVVFRIAETVMVMDRGRLVAVGPPAAIRADARVREVYLGGGLADEASGEPREAGS